ncbi:Myblike DNAbinding domain-containing protein [Entomortierella beljakovae]|nr:Myblike DNAbinding domain-containing protein [Entomortierella beljakovae]
MSWLAFLATNSRSAKCRFSTRQLIWSPSNTRLSLKPTSRIQPSRVLQTCQWIHTSFRTRAGQSTAQPHAIVTDSRLETQGSKIKKKSYTRQPPVLFKWTPEHDNKIVELRLEGNGWEEIGEALQRPAYSVRQRYLKHLDHALHNGWTPEKIERLNAAVSEGKTWRMIAEEFTTTASACRERWISENPALVQIVKETKSRHRRQTTYERQEKAIAFKDNGFVVYKRSTWSDQMDSVLLELRSRGLSWREIGSTIAIVPHTCFARHRYLKNIKLESGWIPLKLDTSNTPNYLLSSRRDIPPAASSCIDIDRESSNVNPSIEEEMDTPTEPLKESTGLPFIPMDSMNSMDPLGALGDDFSYDVYNTYPERTWSKEDDAAILHGRNEDYTFASIAYDLQLEPMQVYDRYHTVLDPKLKDLVWTPGMTEQLLFYVSQGLSWPVIGKNLGVHRAVCKKVYREFTRPVDVKPDSSESVNCESDGSTLDTPRKFGEELGHGKYGALNDHQGDYADQYLEDDEEEDDDDDNYDCYDDDAIHGLVNRHKSHNEALDDINDGDSDDDDSSGLLDANSLRDSEMFTDDPIITGRRSKKRRSIAFVSGTESDNWDQESTLREIQKTWTPKDETILIQHVIRNGTRGWDEISRHLEGHHSAEECRAYWKYLDMPLRGYRPQVQKLEPHREKQFWGLWANFGSDFEEISKRMGGSDAIEDSELLGNEGQSSTRFSPEECEEFFRQQTRGFGINSDGVLDPEKFRNECTEMALGRIKNLQFHWNKVKSVRLQKLVLQRIRSRDIHVNWVNWKWVARHVGGVTPQRCRLHWKVLREAEAQKADWTHEDIMLLERGIREVGSIFNDKKDGSLQPLPLDQGAENHVGLSNNGIRTVQRFYLPDKSFETIQRKYFLLSDKASRVNLDEYMAIMNTVDTFGDDQWEKVAESLKPRTSDETASSTPSTSDEGSISGKIKPSFSGWTKAPIRRVWESSYKFQLLNTKWTPEEDEDLKVVIDRIGQRNWNAACHFFPGKSGWQCRLRWCQLTDPVPPKS